MKISDTGKEKTIKLIKHYVERSDEVEQPEAGWYSWEFTPVEDTSRNSNDASLIDTGEKTCFDDISQGKAVEGEDTGPQNPDKASILLVKTQAFDENENHKPTQNEINVQLFFKVNNEIGTDTEESATESDYPHEKFTINTGQEEMVGKIHTGIRETDELSTHVESDHPSNISGRQQVELLNYPDRDQKEHVVTKQPIVESNETEETHKAPRGGNLEEDSCEETNPNKTIYKKEV